jgi:hypothetical protein
MGKPGVIFFYQLLLFVAWGGFPAVADRPQQGFYGPNVAQNNVVQTDDTTTASVNVDNMSNENHRQILATYSSSIESAAAMPLSDIAAALQTTAGRWNALMLDCRRCSKPAGRSSLGLRCGHRRPAIPVQSFEP